MANSKHFKAGTILTGRPDYSFSAAPEMARPTLYAINCKCEYVNRGPYSPLTQVNIRLNTAERVEYAIALTGYVRNMSRLSERRWVSLLVFLAVLCCLVPPASMYQLSVAIVVFIKLTLLQKW